MNAAFQHVCEACGRTETLTSQQAYEAGWDYPPRIGTWTVVSPRTCGNCGIKSTLWWTLAMEKKTLDDLTPAQRQTLVRILDEKDPEAHDA